MAVDEPALRVRLPRFSPSYNGFHFSSANLAVPDTLITLPGGSQLPLSAIAPNLSGGLSFMVADYFVAGARPPLTANPPAATDPLMSMLINRQVSTFDPGRVAFIFGLMSPQVPAADPSGLSFAPAASRARVMLLEEWPRIESALRLGIPVQLVVVAQVTPDARIMAGMAHQVMGYGYDIFTDPLPVRVQLWVYDPQLPDRDDIRLSFSLTPTSRPMTLTYSDGLPVAGFFHVPFAPQPLPAGAPTA